MFGIIGAIAVVTFMTYVSLGLFFIILYGGEEFSRLPLKQYWWMLPMIIAMVLAWGVLFNTINISVSIL